MPLPYKDAETFNLAHPGNGDGNLKILMKPHYSKYIFFRHLPGQSGCINGEHSSAIDFTHQFRASPANDLSSCRDFQLGPYW